jgi:ligand-binding SRPBCC domain-containing protein
MIDIQRVKDRWVVRCEQWFPKPVDEVWPFFSDAFNLEEITPPYLRFEILTPKPIEMGVGALIDYRLRLHGVPIKWKTEIAAWEPPHRFIDDQIKGPYKLWRHEHRFIEKDGGTLATDRVEYQLPGGPLAVLANAAIVQRDVHGIFAFRQVRLAERFGSAETASA